ncbi:thioredoxin family protein [Demequina activiva]|uniref:Redox-active disulfide protein 2 n=1 Tax=Demequina activiva TaxID=1582364 RepID=A0A919UG15_9MICO|nr:thioredoxin family protein [Demequina activiva]GIG54357.1 redox-active disulfide protein 2 [Demequina activiva]
MTIEILGPACPTNDGLERLIRDVAAQDHRDIRVFTITDPAQVAAYGARSTPGLAVNGLLKVVGRVPTAEEIRALLSDD